MIIRSALLEAVESGLRQSPIVALLGPRQCGKTTLARGFVPSDSANYFDLEDPEVAALLANPMNALKGLRGLIVIDEVQRAPSIFPVLRVLADRENPPARFLILGSASPELSRQASESLAGRVRIVEMQGFGMDELPPGSRDDLWLRGGFPRSYLASDDATSFLWRRDFVSTFLERDLGVLGFGMAPAAMGRFWTMLSHYHGQTWNASEVAASMGVAPNTARHYLDALEQTYLVRRLMPWHENLGKRLVKAPKIYFRDSGLFHCLQGIESLGALHRHPKLGASWEGFVLEAIDRRLGPVPVHFHAIHSGSELDLFYEKDGIRTGIEIKWSDAPKLTRSMRIAQADLRLDRLFVVYPGERTYELADGIEVVPLGEIAGRLGA